MSNLPPDSKALRREFYAGLAAFVVGFVVTLGVLGWLIVRFVGSDGWWDVLHACLEALLIAVLGGLGLAVGVVCTLSWFHHRRGVYRCLFCGQPLKRAGAICDCRREFIARYDHNIEPTGCTEPRDNVSVSNPASLTRGR
jgi:hypothetical protein